MIGWLNFRIQLKLMLGAKNVGSWFAQFAHFLFAS